MVRPRKPSIVIAYHFFYPDDVVSAQQKTALAIGLYQRGWDVTVLTSNRTCRDAHTEILPLEETWEGLKIIRVPRPAYSQSSNLGRLLNSWNIQRGWLKRLRQMKSPPDVLLLGTDPQFSQAMLPRARKIFPLTKLALWCFDLYPEILAAAGGWSHYLAAKTLAPFAKRWGQKLDTLIDIGPCMRERLRIYGHAKSHRSTIVPWALVEPSEIASPEPLIRQELFGNAKIGLLYSGSFGHAHEHRNFLELARRLRDSSVAFCFAGTGNRMEFLKSIVTKDDHNIRFAGFCALEDLQRRLEAADIHLISLKQGWEGLVVPSKFFGALAAGKPVIYDGAAHSDIGIWVDQFDLGFNLSARNVPEVAAWLAGEGQHSASVARLQKNAFEVYQQNFRKETMMNLADAELRRSIV